MRQFKILLIGLVFFGVLSSCIEKYNPPAISNPESYLVIEGTIEPENTQIKLSRTTNLNDGVPYVPETQALVSIENKNHEFTPLKEISVGNYMGLDVELNSDEEYRLNIQTQDGIGYVSDYMKVKQSPEIDKVYWESTADGVSIFLDTHDSNNETQFYRWKFIETWEFTSNYFSLFKYEDGEVIRRDENNIYRCWQSDTSNVILTTSTNGLGEDIVYRYPLTKLKKGDWKIINTYSILVRQFAVSQEEYEFYKLLKKNTEELGTFFDSQPSQVRGNIHCTTDNNKKAIGYVGVARPTEKRIFIENDSLDNWIVSRTCDIAHVSSDSIDIYFGEWGYIPIGFDQAVHIYTAANARCVDCTFKGKAKKPDFWKE